MSEMAHMDITIDLALKRRLAALAEATHREKSALVGEAIAHFLDVQDWQHARIEKGIAAADRGEFATPEEVERVFTKYQPGTSDGDYLDATGRARLREHRRLHRSGQAGGRL